MVRGKLRISGPDGAYRPGEPMLVHDGPQCFGTLAAPELSRDGASLHFGQFSPAATLRNGHRQFAPLMLVEVMSFLAEQYPRIETLRFTLTRQVEMHGDGLKVAMARLSLLERIGASNVQVRPRPDSDIPGNFVVQGVWECNAPNLAALAAELLAQRTLYFEEAASAPGGLASLAARWLARGWRRDGA